MEILMRRPLWAAAAAATSLSSRRGRGGTAGVRRAYGAEFLERRVMLSTGPQPQPPAWSPPPSRGDGFVAGELLVKLAADARPALRLVDEFTRPTPADADAAAAAAGFYG